MAIGQERNTVCLAWSYVLPDICHPIPRRIESFGKIGKTWVFSYKPTICSKNPGFSPKSRVNPGFAFEPEKFLGFRRLGYIYIYHLPPIKGTRKTPLILFEGLIMQLTERNTSTIKVSVVDLHPLKSYLKVLVTEISEYQHLQRGAKWFLLTGCQFTIP